MIGTHSDWDGPNRHDKSRRPLMLFAFISLLLFQDQILAQQNRRLYLDPGLILESSSRLGACDVLRFTSDGSRLIACGDDKVVRIWPVSSIGLEVDQIQNLRWSIYRERRGNIYAMDVSPDTENRWIAIGGHGVRNGSVAILDRISGRVAFGLTPDKTKDSATIWSIAFAPSGDKLAYGTDDGSVWVWKFKEGGGPFRLGRVTNGNGFNHVRLVRFQDETSLLSVTQDGAVKRWNSGRPDSSPQDIFKFRGTRLFRVAASRDGAWLAAANQERSVRIEVCSVDGRNHRILPLDGDDMPQCLAFDSNASRLAVGMRNVPTNASFFKIRGSHVAFYDLGKSEIKSTVGPRLDFYAEAVAFHPDGKRLAVAGGSNYEISLWDLENSDQPIDVVRGPGRAIWSVGFDPATRQLGIRTQRINDPPHPNRRGEGEWKVFDLGKRSWVLDTSRFSPIEPLSEFGGWKVQPTSEPLRWNVVGPDQKTFPLPLDPERDGIPQCFTFLKPQQSQDVPRLAVGHYWGVSVFDLAANGPVRTRLMTGHQGEVMAVAPSADHRLLVSASRDQTVAAWNLTAWPSQSELGAGFQFQKEMLVVATVDPGSPAWESGLLTGDEVVLLAFDGQEVSGGPAAWQRRLREPIPGKELFFRVRRGALNQTKDFLTTVRQRPLWRFFPTEDREWVLWRWHDYYYDTSTAGDSYIGWQINGEVDQTPEFHSAEMFRRRFHRPDKITESLSKMTVDTAWVPIPTMLPPEVGLEIPRRTDKSVTVKISVRSRGDSFVEQPQEVSLWVNDFRFQQWTTVPAPFELSVEVPIEKLRRGSNEIIAQSYNQAGLRADSQREKVVVDREPRPAHLYGLVVGISDYSKTKGGKWPSLIFPTEDAIAIRDIWGSQKRNSLYHDSRITILTEDQVSIPAIRKHLEDLSQRVEADDSLLFFLAGHGYAKLTAGDTAMPGTFSFVIPGTFDMERPTETGLSSATLFEGLSKIPCRKLILLDACHSYGSADLVRELTPTGVGPIIFTACDSRESAFELPYLGHGVFTTALLEALGEKSDSADLDKNGFLTSDELFAHIGSRVPVIVQKGRGLLGPDATQTPRRYQGRQDAGAINVAKVRLP